MPCKGAEWFMIAWLVSSNIIYFNQSQESLIAMRFREADSTMELAEMKQKIQTLESKVIDRFVIVFIDLKFVCVLYRGFDHFLIATGCHGTVILMCL